ncbi:MAG: hypothetical protein ABSA78_22620 [Candidatus Sulfotelmatobacter sp.]|jgi:hypothetical protein
MAENESLRKTLEHYLQLKASKLEEVRQLDVVISQLSRDLGEAVPRLQPEEEDASDSIGDAWRDNEFGTTAPASSGTRTSVRADEFVGLTYSGAAKAYLEKVGHAVSMEELLEVLNRGGCPVGGKEPKKTLYISLIRDVRTFVPIPGRSGFLGLRKFYPNLKALKDKKDEPKKRKKGSRKKKAARGESVAPRGKPGPKPKGDNPTISKEKSHQASDQTLAK